MAKHNSYRYNKWVRVLRVKEKKYAEYEGICPKCGKPMTWEEASGHHVIPVADGGDESEKNIDVMHVRCHHRLHDRLRKKEQINLYRY